MVVSRLSSSGSRLTLFNLLRKNKENHTGEKKFNCHLNNFVENVTILEKKITIQHSYTYLHRSCIRSIISRIMNVSSVCWSNVNRLHMLDHQGRSHGNITKAIFQSRLTVPVLLNFRCRLSVDLFYTKLQCSLLPDCCYFVQSVFVIFFFFYQLVTSIVDVVG